MSDSIEKTEEIKYTKEQLILAEKYKHDKDILNVILNNDILYSFDEVKKIIDKVMKGKVK